MVAPIIASGNYLEARWLKKSGFDYRFSLTKCSISWNMEHAGIAHGTTVGLSVPIFLDSWTVTEANTSYSVTQGSRPCRLFRSRVAKQNSSARHDTAVAMETSNSNFKGSDFYHDLMNSGWTSDYKYSSSAIPITLVFRLPFLYVSFTVPTSRCRQNARYSI